MPTRFIPTRSLVWGPAWLIASTISLAGVKLPTPAFPEASTPHHFVVEAIKKRTHQHHGYRQAVAYGDNGQKIVTDVYVLKDAAGAVRRRTNISVYIGSSLHRFTSSIDNEIGRWQYFPLIGAAICKLGRGAAAANPFTADDDLLKAYDAILNESPVASPVGEGEYYEVVMELNPTRARRVPEKANSNRLPQRMKFLISPASGAIMGYTLYGARGIKAREEHYTNVTFERPDGHLFVLPRETRLFFAKTDVDYSSVFIHWELLESQARVSLRRSKQTK